MNNSEKGSPSDELIYSLLEHYQNGRLNDAEKLAVEITRDFPKHEFAWKVLGVIFEATGRKSEALNANKTAVKLSPQDAEAHNNLGNTLKELGRLDEAEASYNQALVLKPDYAEAHCNLGIILHHSGKLDKAEASYRQAIALKPEFPEAYSNLGITLQEAGKLKEADASYNQAIELSPGYAEAHSNLGNMLKELGRLEEAEASYNQAIALEPNLAEAHNNLGTTLQELGRLEEAKARWEQSLLLKPNFFDGVRNLVKLPVGQLEPDAINLCEKSLASVDSSLENQIKYLFAQGNLFKHQGLIERSFKVFCKANKLQLEISKNEMTVDSRKNIAGLKRIDSWVPSLPKFSEKILAKLFIMGPSRSGKSLLEHILAESLQVKTLREIIKHNELSKNEGFKKYASELLFEKLFSQSEGNLFDDGYKIVTSTNPGSIFYSDYLLDMLPSAYFIIVKRDPRDISPEIFTSEYNKENFYSYDVNEIKKYLDVYYQVFETLVLKVPDRCLSVSFKDIVQAPEDVVARISRLVGTSLRVGDFMQNLANFEYESLFRDHYTALSN